MFRRSKPHDAAKVPQMIVPDVPVLPERFSEIGLGDTLFPPTVKVHVNIYRVDLSMSELDTKCPTREMGFAIQKAERIIPISLARGAHFAASGLVTVALMAIEHEYSILRLYGTYEADALKKALFQLLVDDPVLLPLINVVVTDLRALHRFHFDPGSIFRNPNAFREP